MTSKEEVFVNRKLARINSQMIDDFGGDNKYWTKIIINTDTYRQILDTKTKMYLEGTIYLCDCLIAELKQRGELK